MLWSKLTAQPDNTPSGLDLIFESQMDETRTPAPPEGRRPGSRAAK